MGNEILVNKDNFSKEVLETEGVVLVDFWAPWCGPCKVLGPVIEELAQEYLGKVKVCKCDVDENGEVAAEYGIRSIPTIMIFKNGKMERQSLGTQSKDAIVSLFRDYL